MRTMKRILLRLIPVLFAAAIGLTLLFAGWMLDGAHQASQRQATK